MLHKSAALRSGIKQSLRVGEVFWTKTWGSTLAMWTTPVRGVSCRWQAGTCHLQEGRKPGKKDYGICCICKRKAPDADKPLPCEETVKEGARKDLLPPPVHHHGHRPGGRDSTGYRILHGCGIPPCGDIREIRKT